ncbi:MAG: hypothetical protein KAT17_07575 [Candidatus Aminicenantes bacterium]|nr:hypothetical protein [Candidatus Aminicenantes bacterium]
MISIKKTGQEKIAVNAIIMIVISTMLFWLPIVGSFIGGFVGGRRISNTYTFLYAVLFSSISIGIFFFLLAQNMTALPVVGAIARKGSLYLSLSFMIPLVAGSITGFSYGK